MSLVNEQILLVSRPQGEATVDNFKLVNTPLPTADQQTAFAALEAWTGVSVSVSAPTLTLPRAPRWLHGRRVLH